MALKIATQAAFTGTYGRPAFYSWNNPCPLAQLGIQNFCCLASSTVALGELQPNQSPKSYCTGTVLGPTQVEIWTQVHQGLGPAVLHVWPKLSLG